MKQPKVNRERAKRAELTLKAGKYWDCGESYAVADLLDDLRHLCDREGWSFERELERAAMHYDAERKPDDIELDVRRMHARGQNPIVPTELEAAHG
jgi:hypothetical protein